MRKLGAKIVLALVTATCRQHQLSICFRPNLFEEAKHSEGPGEGSWGLGHRGLPLQGAVEPGRRLEPGVVLMSQRRQPLPPGTPRSTSGGRLSSQCSPRAGIASWSRMGSGIRRLGLSPRRPSWVTVSTRFSVSETQFPRL